MAKNKKLILIVEDELSLLNALKEKFINEGLAVLLAADGEEGLKAALEKHPDLILLDILLPKMDGMTMLKKLREENDWGKQAKVILLTNLDSAEKVAEGIKMSFAGSYDYLVKTDWTLDEVVEKVKNKLGK